MGQPSLAIYAHELLREYDVADGHPGRLLRRAHREARRCATWCIASGACTDSSMNRIRFEGLDYAPVADFGLLRAAYDAAQGLEPTPPCTSG